MSDDRTGSPETPTKRDGGGSQPPAPSEGSIAAAVPVAESSATSDTMAVASPSGTLEAARTPRKSAPTLNDSPAARKAAQRVRMALRIPDDEVSRPSETVRSSEPPSEPEPVRAQEGSGTLEPTRPSERARRASPVNEAAPESGEPIELDDAITGRAKLPPPPPTLRQGSRPSFPPVSTGRIALTPPGPSATSNLKDGAVVAGSSPNIPAGNVDPSSMREMRAAVPLSAPREAAAASTVSTAFPPEAKTAPATPDATPRERMNAISEEAGAVDVRFDDEPGSQPTTRSSAPDIEPEDLLAVAAAPNGRAASPASGNGLASPLVAHGAAPTSGGHAAVLSPSQSRLATSPFAPPPLTDAAREKKRGKPWWEELFNDDYLRTMAKITDSQIASEATFIEESLAVQKGATLLDLACGTGRHAIELSHRGYQVVGYDLSLAMLARASEEATERGEKLNFVQGDMREMAFEETFDGIYCWNTSFGFFEEEKNAQIVGKVHRALKSGGQFLLDVANRDFIGRQAPSLAWFEGEGCMCMDEMTIDWVTSRMRVKRTMMMDDGRTREIEYSVRIYSLHELGKLLHDHGFRVAEVSGRTATPGVFFGAESPRTLILAEKR